MESHFLKQPLKLSKNAEKHIRKHFKEFGFEELKDFTRKDILQHIQSVISNTERTFYHQHKSEIALVIIHDFTLLIIDVKRSTIKTMFKVFDEEYIEQKIKRKYWIEII